MLIRTIAFCGLASSACWAGIAYPGSTSYLTSTARSVPTLDQVSRIQTPGYMSAGRTFDSFVLQVSDGGPSAPGLSAQSPAAPEIGVVNASFGVNNGGFQIETSSFSSFDGEDSQREFVNLLAGSTSFGNPDNEEFGFSSYSFVPGGSRGSESSISDGGLSVDGGSPSTNDITGGDTSSPAPAPSYQLSSLGRFAAPQAISVEPVPEPSTGVAAGLATGVLAWLRFRKRAQK